VVLAQSFPAVYESIPTSDLLEALEAAPLRIRMVTQGLSVSELEAHPIAGKWSIGQIVCHLADAEVVGAFRFRVALAQPGSSVPAYDPDAWSDRLRDPGSIGASVDRALTLFAALRADVHPLIRDLPPAGFAQTVVHPEWGNMSIRQLLELYADHGERHLSQILDRRRLLGRSLDLPLLLVERLY
jgi:DinB superfamily